MTRARHKASPNHRKVNHMDKLKVKLHLQAADRATDELIKAATAGDFRQVGNQEHRLREALYSLRVELGIVRDLADLKSEAQPLEKIYTCPTCGAHHEDGGRGKYPAYCDECGADWPA